jgi:hypothetical protein
MSREISLRGEITMLFVSAASFIVSWSARSSRYYQSCVVKLCDGYL